MSDFNKPFQGPSLGSLERFKTFDPYEEKKSYKKHDISVYAFDGVIINGFEEALYDYENYFDEAYRIETLNKVFKLQIDGLNLKYTRHLMFQKYAYITSRPIQSGLAHNYFINDALFQRTFVLTARSGYWATKRMYQFLDNLKFKPLEVFSIGRIPKQFHIQTLLNSYYGSIITYYDNDLSILEDIEHYLAHSDDCNRDDKLRRLKLVHVDTTDDKWDGAVKKTLDEMYAYGERCSEDLF